MSSVLQLENLRKSFGSEIVLRDLSLALEEHTVTVLIGASGSGKSTLLRCVNLLEDVDDGRILLDGDDITAPAVDVIARRYAGRPTALRAFIEAPRHPMREQQFLSRDLTAIGQYIASLQGQRW